MKITIEPTEIRYTAPINGTVVPTRIWAGTTDQGTKVELYVLAVVSVDKNDHERLQSELPGFVKKARDTFRIDIDATPEEIRARHLHHYGTEPPD